VHLTVPALLDALGPQREALASLATHTATLEDVFMSLTGRHLRDE
jgi:ABC-2 type transport system ATP-binding protein